MEEATAINLELTKRREEKIKEAQVALESRRESSSQSHIAYFDKLTVLSAGSIGVALSLVGAGLSSKTAFPLIVSHAAWLVLCALSLLFVSLVLCPLHNYVELSWHRKQVPFAALVLDQVVMGRAFDFGYYNARPEFSA